jgi:hypothetical protein
MVSMLRLSHSVHLAVCTVTLLYFDSSTVQSVNDEPPGVRGARVGKGLLEARGVLGRSVRSPRPGVEGAGAGAGEGMSIEVESLALRPAPGVAGGSIAPRGEPCLDGDVG